MDAGARVADGVSRHAGDKQKNTNATVFRNSFDVRTVSLLGVRCASFRAPKPPPPSPLGVPVERGAGFLGTDGSRSCGEFRRMLGVIGADSANADHCE